MKLCTAGITAAILLISPLAHAADCRKILGLHGFKAQAQASCGYGQRPNQAIDMARSCAQKQNPGVNMSEIDMGANVFRVNEAKMGHDALCEDVFAKFPGIFTR